MTDRDKVLTYLNHQYTKPLKFYVQPNGKKFFDPYGNIDQEATMKKLHSLKNKGLCLRTMITRVMELCQVVPTLEMRTSTKFNIPPSSYQCSPGRRRTAVDIWRIIIYYRPDVEIFDVMRTLHYMVTKGSRDMTTSYCNLINRRTFRFEHAPQRIYNEYSDEFGLPFSRWQNI